ncbi:MAG TPA: high-affinity branched-chain amino acid ABC transporter permease LivM [Bauldia sp.]|nr:high-affinity branched-chain amino acid ABC transporter permease LivM [Bauldia sp.]
MADASSTQPTADFRPEGAEIQEEERARAFAGEPPAVTAPVRGRVSDSVRDAIIAAIVALALFGPLVGLQTTPLGAGLGLIPRWRDVAIIVAVVFVGRLLLNLFVWKTDRPITASIARFFNDEPVTIRDWIPIVVIAAILVALNFVAGDVGLVVARLAIVGLIVVVVRKYIGPYLPALPYGRIFGALFLVVALVLPVISEVFIPQQSRYLLDQAIVVLTYTMLGWGLNVVVGYAGLLDLGYVAFYAVGAYSFALLAVYFGWSFWICLPLAGLLAATWGMILGFPVLRLRGDYLALVTIAFGEIIRLVLINWNDFTGGPNGISNIPRPSFFGLPFEREGGFAEAFGLTFSPIHRIIWLYYIILVLALITGFVASRLRRLPVGRAWEALREDEIACRSLGINTTTTKLSAFAIGAMFAGFAGSFFATRQGFISPESFNSLESFLILAVVVLGGLGSQLGVVIAVIFLNTVFELRELAEYRMLIVGLSMVLIMVWRPRGLISTRQPSAYLRERKTVAAANVSQGRG